MRTFSQTRLVTALLAVVVTATGVWAAGEEEPTPEPVAEVVKDPTTGAMVTAPEYGGMIVCIVHLNTIAGIDPNYDRDAQVRIQLVNEKLATSDWGSNRDEFDHKTLYQPPEIFKGQLAESWEVPVNPHEFVFNIRNGVHWHDKAPMNGRELTAHDVAYNFERYAGLGQFSDVGPGPAGPGVDVIPFESIRATNDATVVMKLKEPYLDTLRLVFDVYSSFILPPEVIDEHGGLRDWRTLVGTGPFEMTEWVEDVSITYTKNPDYWGYDEKFEKNRLPYADTVRYLMIPEPASRLASMRTGKADFIGFGLNSHLTNVDSAVNLQKTHPYLVLHPYAYRSETAINFDNQKAPFDDLRVRRALSMAIDQESIAENYMQGWGDASPVGGVGKAVLGYFIPYEKWPEDVRQYYRYDPEAAEKLLDEAGYPRGADGVRFKTVYEHLETFDLGYYEIAMDYLRQIGIEIEIQNVSRAEMIEKALNHSFLGLRSDVWAAEYPSATATLQAYWSQGGWRPANVNDEVFDGYFENALAATTIDEQKEWMKQADLRVAEQLWTIRGPIAPQFSVTQPWLKGYNGEFVLGVPVFARLWVDQDLKEEMGL